MMADVISHFYEKSRLNKGDENYLQCSGLESSSLTIGGRVIKIKRMEIHDKNIP